MILMITIKVMFFFFFGRRENHQITPAARRVERQAYRQAVSRLNGSRGPGIKVIIFFWGGQLGKSSV